VTRITRNGNKNDWPQQGFIERWKKNEDVNITANTNGSKKKFLSWRILEIIYEDNFATQEQAQNTLWLVLI
jgi:hypothetical protein